MRAFITRPTNMALALVGAAESAIVATMRLQRAEGKKVDHHAAAVPWVARRVYDAPEHAGMVREPAITAHLSQRTYNALDNGAKGVI